MNLLIKRTYKQSIIILLSLSILSAFIEWKRLPVSILIGGTLGLANLKGLVRGVEGLIRTKMPATAIIFSSIIRFTIIAFILTILIIHKLINIFGVLIGFTVVFTMILIEGWKTAKEL